MFSCEFCEISKNIYFKEHLWANVFTYSYFLNFLLLQKHFCNQIFIMKVALLHGQMNTSLHIYLLTTLRFRTVF